MADVGWDVPKDFKGKVVGSKHYASIALMHKHELDIFQVLVQLLVRSRAEGLPEICGNESKSFSSTSVEELSVEALCK
jgi:hypothetical protein